MPRDDIVQFEILASHLDELTKRREKLDSQIEKLSQHPTVRRYLTLRASHRTTEATTLELESSEVKDYIYAKKMRRRVRREYKKDFPKFHTLIKKLTAIQPYQSGAIQLYQTPQV